MAALTRPSRATYEVHETIKVDTTGTYTCTYLEKQKKRHKSQKLARRLFCFGACLTRSVFPPCSARLLDNEDHTFWYVTYVGGTIVVQ